MLHISTVFPNCVYFINLIADNVYIEMTMPFDIIKDAVGNDVMMLKSHSYTYDVRDSSEIFFDNLYFGNKTASKIRSHATIASNILNLYQSQKRKI